MERTALLNNLDSTCRHIGEVRRLISAHRFILAELIIERRNTTACREALAAMEGFLASLIACRDETEKELAGLMERRQP
jgi:hypothetical protein